MAEKAESIWKNQGEKNQMHNINYARKLFTWRNRVASTLSTAVFCWKNTKS